MVESSLPVTLSTLVASAEFTSEVFAFDASEILTSAVFAFKLIAVKYGLSISAVSAIFSFVSAPLTLAA